MIKHSVYKHVGVEPGQPLPAYAWPGGYQVIYYDNENNILCPACANKEASAGPDDTQYTITGADVFYEGPAENCAECNAVIESAYGDPDAEKGE